MTKLVEEITIRITLEEPRGSIYYDEPRDQLRKMWSAIGRLIDTKGKWQLSGPGVICDITNLGLEEAPEEGGGDN